MDWNEAKELANQLANAGGADSINASRLVVDIMKSNQLKRIADALEELIYDGHSIKSLCSVLRDVQKEMRKI